VLRAVYLTGFLAAIAAIGALAFLRVDVVIVGSAVVTPVGETARVQSASAGTVDAILVRNGDFVHKRQLIVRFDPRSVRSRLTMLTAQAQAVGLRVAMLERLIDARAEVFRMEGKIRQVDRSGVDAKRIAARRFIDARDREREIRARDEISMRRLVVENALARKDMDAAAIRASDAIAQAEAARASLNDVETARLRLMLEEQRLQQDSAVSNLTDGAELAEAKADLVRLQGEIAAAQLEETQLDVIAPRDGVVQGLAVLDRGDVVPVASTIAHIVPGSGALVVKASVATDGIAFIWPKQAVRIKLDAYPFQDFGVFQGHVQRVSRDTTSSERSDRRGTAYDVDVAIVSPPAQRGRDAIELRPGMIGQAEFTVRREPLLAALFRPWRGLTDSVRQ
jgi:multidrug resistance efflux pump